MQHKITKTCCLSGPSAIYVHLFNSKADITKALLKTKKPEVVQLTCKAETLSLSEYTEEANKVLGYELAPKRVSSSKIIEEMMKKQIIRRYKKVQFRPYGVGKPDPVDQDCLNTFSGFELAGYRPTRYVDVRMTQTWKYMCGVFGWSDEYTPRVGELFDRIAYKLQNPGKRSNRIHTLFSAAQGVGKSLLFHFFEMVFGWNICEFYGCLDEYQCRFNITHNSKLIHFIDDIRSAGHKRTRDLYTKCTRKTQKYEGKGEKVFTMEEFSEMWITGQDLAASLFVESEDRRILIYEASDMFKGNHKFFEDVVNEMKDHDVAYAWFTFLNERELGDYTPNHDSKESKALKQRAILKSMNKAHRFMEYFFSCDNWHLMFMGQEFAHHWFRNVSVEKILRGHDRGKIRIRVSQSWLYAQFKQWMSTHMPNSGRFDQPTFLERIQQVGVIVPLRKQRLWGTTCRVVDVVFKTFEKAYCERYNCEAVTEWPTESPEGVSRIREDIAKHMKKN